ncbi:MAG: hypothetical protein O8C56_03160, partial [Candidatus Methanoperedens sp.]|nr:hypothetical protein [Candidatus Methanoperedens sp.]
ETPSWQDYGLREYDTRTCRFISEDPLTKQYPWYTPYQFAGNKPIQFIDLDGGEEKKSADADKEEYTAVETTAHGTPKTVVDP